MSDKTEEATPKRLRKARSEGDSGASSFASQSVALLAAVVLVPTTVVAVVARVGDRLRAAVGAAGEVEPSAHFDAARVAGDVVALSAPLLLGVALAAGAASLAQTGGFIATKKLAPRLDRINVAEGLKNLVSRTRLFAVARALVGASVVAWLVVRALRTHAGDFARLTGRLEHVGPAVAAITKSLAWDAALVGLGLAAIDLVVVRLEWRRRLRMSKEEVRREYKESEGDPQVKAARERAHHEMLASVAIGNVRTASVVVVNPTHLACALRYEEAQGDEAPVVVAAGEGELAEAIVRAARDYGVPIVRDVPLARALVELGIGEAIPEVLYEAVAEILRDAWEQR